MNSDLKRAFDFYLANQDAMVEQYDGRFIVIKDDEVLGAYDSELEAVTETQQAHPLGTFLVQRVSAGEADYTAKFHSRVSVTTSLQASVEKNYRLGELLADARPPSLDEWWPVHPTARLQEGVSLRREDMYEERA